MKALLSILFLGLMAFSFSSCEKCYTCEQQCETCEFKQGASTTYVMQACTPDQQAEVDAQCQSWATLGQSYSCSCNQTTGDSEDNCLKGKDADEWAEGMEDDNYICTEDE